MSINGRGTSNVGTSLAANPEPWWERALCKGIALKGAGSPMDPRQEGETTQQATARHDEAKRKWCHACPVKAECYEDGVKSGGYGVYGGITLHLGSEDHSCRHCGYQLHAQDRNYCGKALCRKAAREAQARGDIPVFKKVS